MRHLPRLRIAKSRPAGALFAALLIVLFAAAVAAASASAGSVNKIFEDCGESKIPVGFSQQATPRHSNRCRPNSPSTTTARL